MSTSDDTLSLPARLFQAQTRLSIATAQLDSLAVTTAVYLDDLHPGDLQTHLAETLPLSRELWAIRDVLMGVRRDLVRQLPLQIGPL